MRETNPADALKAYCDRWQTQREAAARLGISPAYLSDLLNNRRDLTDGILAKIGLKRIVVREK